MKRALIYFLVAVFLLCFFSCAQGEGVIDDSTVSEDFMSLLSSEAESDIVESENPFLDIAADMLPLFENPNNDPDYEDKINNFLNFIYEEFGEEAIYNIYADIKAGDRSDEVWLRHTGNSIHVLRSLFKNDEDNLRIISLGDDSDGLATITFGGDVCFGDNYATMPYLQNRKGGVLSECISQPWIDLMNEVDVATLNNEFSISDRGKPMKHKTYTYVAKPEHTKYYNEMGVDFVTLANNHVFDYGKDAFYDTLDTLDEYGIDYAGAGRNASEAQKPFYYVINGRKFAFISATRAEKNVITPEATESEAGVFRCYDNEKLISVIEETKRDCDFLILYLHWGTEYSHKLERVQKESSHEYIDAGADLIVGTHAHCLQGIEFYKGKAIFYNLGNFWFNAKNIETGLLKLEYSQDGRAEYYFIPGVQSGCKVSYELGTERGREILDNLSSYEPSRVLIEDDGRVIDISEE